MLKIIHCSGKRKRAIARATLRPGKGRVVINNKPVDIYASSFRVLRIKEPLLLAGDLARKVDISVKVNGGGINSQADAARLAIAKTLAQFSKPLEKVFLGYDRHLLVADVRRREAYKPNDSRARAARQKSYR